MPGRLLLLLALTFCGSLPAPPTSASDAQSAPAGSEPEARSADLPERYRQWLEEVAPLLSPEERKVFSSLTRDYQRQAFIRRFWEVRDPYPNTPRNEFRERYEERLALARQRFPTLAEDRAQVLLVIGEPQRFVRALCPELVRPLEIWSYDGTEVIRQGFHLIFIESPGGVGRLRLWSPSEGLTSLVQPALWAAGAGGEGAIASALARDCSRADELLGAVGAVADFARIKEAAPVIPRPGAEWALTFAARSTDVPADAEPLPATLDLAFPRSHQSRTVVEGTVSVPGPAVTPGAVGPRRSYNFLLDGEILLRGELFDSFRYRFDLPAAEAVPEAIPLVIERFLRPGAYTLVVRLQDLHGQRFFRQERELLVPRLAGGMPGPAAAVAPAPTAPSPEIGFSTELPASSALAAESLPEPAEPSVRLLAPPPELVTGKLRVEAVVTGLGVARLTFELDGRRVLAKARPPWSVELDLGRAPRLHSLRATAVDARGQTLASDEILLNGGPHRFGVRLTEPRRGQRVEESLRASAEVDVPEGENLDRVEFFLNETRLATLFQPPFVQPLPLPPGEEIAYVRAVAFLVDGNSTEDLVFVNAPEYLEQVEVDYVELYTTVLDRQGRPVEDLERQEFEVLEEGRPQEIVRFERVEDLSVWAGILLDTSSSMLEQLPEAVRAALRFFATVITPRDRGAVITFADRPRLAVRFTNDLEILAGGLTGLAAEGETALYDSVVYALHYFSALKGKRALVVLSDGMDSASRYRFEDALEFSRRTGVAIYTIAINLPTSAADARFKLEQLANETGGRSFYISRAAELESVYRAIQQELRSQYLLTYQSAQPAAKEGFRSVEVRMRRQGLAAKTMRGYLP